MRVVVYGTLKSGYGNNVLLSSSKLLGPKVVPGYSLYNAGFPVARPSKNESILGELWEIDGPKTLYNLDRLEGEGRMYIRTEIEPDTFMYVGPENFWNFDGNGSGSSWRQDKMSLCPKNSDGHYEWSRG